MPKLIPWLTGLLVVALVTGCSLDQDTPRERDTVTVSGEGSVKAPPDRFTLVAVARERGDDVAGMKDTVDQQVQAMLDLAAGLGIADKDITASDVQVAPEWEYQPERRLLGHQVSREVTFRVPGMEPYAELADGLADLDVREIRPAGSEISNAEELTNEAMEKAVLDAREKAAILARAADRELGEAILIDAQGNQVPGPQPMMYAARAEKDSAESYRPGEQDITASVRVTFALQ